MSWSALLEALLVDIEAFVLGFAVESELPALLVSGGLIVSLCTAVVACSGRGINKVGAAEV